MEPKNGTTREVSPKMMAMAAMTCAAALVTSCPTAFSCFQDSFNTGQTEKQQRGSRLPVLLEHTAAQGQRGNDHHQQTKDYATNGATKQSRFEGRLGCPECWQDRLRTLTFRTTATKPKRRNRRMTWSNCLPSQAMACITPAESTRRPRERAIFRASAAGRCHSKHPAIPRSYHVAHRGRQRNLELQGCRSAPHLSHYGRYGEPPRSSTPHFVHSPQQLLKHSFHCNDLMRFCTSWQCPLQAPGD